MMNRITIAVMTVPALAVSTESALDQSVDVLVLGVSSTESGPQLRTELADFDAIKSSLSALGVTGAEDELRRLPSPNTSVGSIALIGLGSGEPTTNSLRRAAGSAARQLIGAGSLAFALPTADDAGVQAVLEGAAIGAYSFSAYRSAAPENGKQPAASVTAVATSAPADDIAARAAIVAEAVHTVRDLVNTPPSDLYPETFAQEAQDIASDAPVTVTVLAEDELEREGFGGILGVGKGSTRGPRLVKVEYSPADASQHLALVGKGITFDSGGLSLKPPASMVGMKYDMTGAATSLAVTVAAARLGLPLRVTAWLCLAENLPSGSAMRPNDVLRIRGGKTVEVLNTDAEGRLVLADGLAAASEEQPDVIVDIATLTGAARVALGDRYVGTMGNGSAVDDLIAAATEVGETFWHMPLPTELRPLLTSDVADITNVKIGSTAAGMLVAGVFLQEFIGNSADGSPIPWVHLDIAGPANNDGGSYGFTGKGPTGVTVRALLAFADRLSRA